MKTKLTVKSIHTGVKMTLTFDNEQDKQHWLETQAHNYIFKKASIKR